MGLSEIADGIEITVEQRDRGVATVEDTEKDLGERLARYADDLPCDPDAAAAVIEAYTGGASVGDAAREAGVPPMTAGKTLHLLGVEGISPLGPRGRRILRDWLRAELSRCEARELTGASEAAFLLAAFVETHDPIEGAREAVEPVLALEGDPAVEKRDALGGTMSDADDLL